MAWGREKIPVMTDRLMLLDTASLYFRAYYGVPATIKAPNGMPVNAVRGLLDFIARLVTDHRPTHLIACWDDDWRPEFRVAAVPSYKVHRVAEEADPALAGESVPDDLIPQVVLIERVLALLGIPRIGVAGFEADDVIATLATQATCAVAIVTGDRDLFQLVDDQQPIKVLYTAAKGVGAADVIDDAAVQAKYGVAANQYADFALLRGDPSDGLPGVRGVGEKTAARLIAEYGSVDALMAAVMAGKAHFAPALSKKLRDSVEYLDVAGPVVRVRRDVPVADCVSQLPTASPDPASLDLFAEQWGLGGSLVRVKAALGWR